MKIIKKLCQNFKRLYYYHLHEFINNYLPYPSIFMITRFLKMEILIFLFLQIYLEFKFKDKLYILKL